MNEQKRMPRMLRDALLTVALLAAAVAFCALLRRFDEGDTYVGLLFVLAVACVSRWTEGYFWGIFSSFFGVVCVNYVFTYPYWEFNFTMTGYPLTFVTLLAVALMVSTMTTQIKRQERLRLETEREAMRADLLRAMSHDIRTPLTSIVGNTAAVLEDKGALSTEQKRSLLQDVNEDAQWLIRMVENILSITRIRGESGGLATECEAAEEVVAEGVRKFSKRFPSVAVTVAVPDEVLLVPMDATLIQQVILNLMENAVIHGGASEICLSVERKGGACFSVSDNGRGIARDKLSSLFDAAPAAARGGSDGKKNMGIGLSVCRTIVKAHGGTMTAKNRASGGEEALSMITSHCPDLIILDLGLPDMDGIEILRAVRSWSNLPVIVVSARTHERDKVAALDQGADDYIEKPFGTSELLARIRTAIRHTRTPLTNGGIAQSGKFTVGALTVDYDKHHVLVDGADVHLTLNEFKIAALLGKYAGKVLTYDYMIREIWGPKAKADNQILRVNMANIRRKIEKNPAAPEYIFTEIGVGYRMRDVDE